MSQRSLLGANALVLLGLSLVGLFDIACFSERAATDATVNTTTCVAPSTAAGSTLSFIRSFVFAPTTIRVKAGGSVTWVNCEPTNIPHTATADGGAWDSANLAPNAAFTRAFPTAGTFPYHCAVHPSMKGTVIVE